MVDDALQSCVHSKSPSAMRNTLVDLQINFTTVTNEIGRRFADIAARTVPISSCHFPWALQGLMHGEFRRALRLPATTECTDQVDAGAQLQGIKTERLQLGLQDGGLRGDDGEIVCRALSVERHGKVERALRRVDRGLLIQRGVVVMIECGQAVFDLLERADNDTTVVRGRGVELGPRLGDLRPAQAAIEHGEQGIWSDRPERAWRAQPVREGTAL